MKKSLLSALFLFIAIPAFGMVPVHKLKHKGAHRRLIPARLELWCGAATGLERDRFPYLAAIHNYRSPSGMLTQTATIYKKGRPVMREYVYQSYRSHHFSYEGSGDTFSLTFDSNKPQNFSRAELKAVIRDEDGDKLIANGSIPCYKAPRS